MFLLVAAYPGSPGQRPLNGCVCVFNGLFPRTTWVNQSSTIKGNTVRVLMRQDMTGFGMQ